MILQFPYSDISGPFVLDASAIINLLGTGKARSILFLLRTPVLVEQTALREVTHHPISGANHTDEFAVLLKEGLLLNHSMNAAGLEIFRALTSGDLAGGLDDGEAATIAHAISLPGTAVPVIDERKAARIFAARWGSRAMIGTLDLLSHSRVVAGMTHGELQCAVHSALLHARMRVPTGHRKWVIGLIGSDRASQCPSLGATRTA